MHRLCAARPQGRETILAALKRFARKVSTEEFEIVEKPILIAPPSPPKRRAEAPAAVSPAAPALGAPEPLAQEIIEKAPKDLLSSVGEILAEHGRLAQIAKELKPASATDDEFGRFARQAVPLIDGFVRLVELGRNHEQSEEFRDWFKTVEALYERIQGLFQNHGLKVMDCLGQKVDFNVHDVIEYRRTADFPHDTVIEEIRKGIVFRGKVLRDAKVVIALNEKS